MRKKKDIATVLLGVTVAMILWVTILSRETLIGTPISYRPFHALISFLMGLQRGRINANFLGNIILFMPIGVLVPKVTSWKKMWKTVAAGIGFSLCLELIQLVTARGCFDLDDVFLNGLGTVIGFGIQRATEKLLTNHHFHNYE